MVGRQGHTGTRATGCLTPAAANVAATVRCRGVDTDVADITEWIDGHVGGDCAGAVVNPALGQSHDVGALLGSLVGQSEANIRQALRLVDAMSPCVVMIVPAVAPLFDRTVMSSPGCIWNA